MSNFDLIEEYLTNRLSEQAKSDFENKINSDPSLRAEVDMQRAVIEGIKKARISDLKVMLKNVPVVSGTSTLFSSSALRMAATVVGAGVLLTSLYFYFKPENILNGPENISTSIKDSLNDSTPIIRDEVEPTKTENPVKSEQEITKESNEPIRKIKKSEKQVELNQPKIDVTDPSSEMNESNSELPVHEKSKISISPSQISVEIQNSDRKHSFHYQFHGGKLVLYGNFEKELYEILEINGELHSLFLYFNKSYYLLDEKQNDITPLEVIKDGALTQKLDLYKNQ